ncbi:hypothetical protein D9M68_996110 [compost metagenome]
MQYAPDQALKTLPALLNDPAERERLLTLLDKLSTDEHVLGSQPTPDQAAMLARIRAALAGKPERIRRAAG